jgi:hypothetical protein
MRKTSNNKLLEIFLCRFHGDPRIFIGDFWNCLKLTLKLISWTYARWIHRPKLGFMWLFTSLRVYSFAQSFNHSLMKGCHLAFLIFLDLVTLLSWAFQPSIFHWHLNVKDYSHHSILSVFLSQFILKLFCIVEVHTFDNYCCY